MSKFSVWYGAAKPLVAIGVQQCRLLDFLAIHKGWHTMGTDRATVRAVQGLVKRGSVVYDPTTNQACIVYAQKGA